MWEKRTSPSGIETNNTSGHVKKEGKEKEKKKEKATSETDKKEKQKKKDYPATTTKRCKIQTTH